MMNVESRIISSLEKVFLAPRFEGAAIHHLSALRGERVHFQIALSSSESAGVTIPDSVTAIGSRAFSGCDNLTIVLTEKSNVRNYATWFGIPVISE